MKKIIEVFRNESRLPYAIGLIQLVFFPIVFFMDTIETSLNSFMTSLDGVVWWMVFLLLCLFWITIVVGPLVFIVKAYKFDRTLSKQKKDERELYHEYLVANAGYKVAIFGLLAIVFFGADLNMAIDPYEVALLGLLLTILGVRMYKRFTLED